MTTGFLFIAPINHVQAILSEVGASNLVEQSQSLLGQAQLTVHAKIGRQWLNPWCVQYLCHPSGETNGQRQHQKVQTIVMNVITCIIKKQVLK